MTRRIIQLNVANNYYSTDGLRANSMVFTIKCELNEKANNVQVNASYATLTCCMPA